MRTAVSLVAPLSLLVTAAAAAAPSLDAALAPLLDSNKPEVLSQIRALVEAGADVTVRSPEGNTVLMSANDIGDPAFMREVLKRGADVNARNHVGETALADGIMRGYDRLVPALLDAGADVNTQDDGRVTPLMYASEGGEEATVRALLTHHARVDLRDAQERTALMWASENDCSTGAGAAIVRMLLRAGADPGARDRAGLTALLIAVRKRTPDPAVVRLLRAATNVRL